MSRFSSDYRRVHAVRIIHPLQAIYKDDPLLDGFRDHLDYRWAQYMRTKRQIVDAEGSLAQFARVRLPTPLRVIGVQNGSN